MRTSLKQLEQIVRNNLQTTFLTALLFYLHPKGRHPESGNVSAISELLFVSLSPFLSGFWVPDLIICSNASCVSAQYPISFHFLRVWRKTIAPQKMDLFVFMGLNFTSFPAGILGKGMYVYVCPLSCHMSELALNPLIISECMTHVECVCVHISSLPSYIQWLVWGKVREQFESVYNSGYKTPSPCRCRRAEWICQHPEWLR